MTHGQTNRGRGGFTIIEVIVVIVILGIVSTVVGVRMASMSRREAEAAAWGIGDVLSTAARRESLSSQLVAVSYSHETKKVVFQAMVAESSEGNARQRWQPDRLVPPVDLGDAEVEAVESDGALLNPGDWRIEFTPGVHRPTLGITVVDSRQRDRWRVELPSNADSAGVSHGLGHGLLSEAVDLDAGGAGSSPW